MNKKMIQQAKKLQQDMMKMQEELENSTVEASSGGGAVKVVVNGKLKLESITISEEVVDTDEIDMLSDLILAAVNEGISKSQEEASSKMSSLTGGLNIPGF
ncbi:MAG: YbaB/EbfC family nucleoid-associated protein [Chloroflexi bacterium]|nr:YbaB/EbfC family nucleoid-associated protein [Chloroflexota bacterium]|tara:strand:+ start:1662 stop:1964 length:303 start_codon:yes stop_codon:yes gene_type:complete